MKIIQVDNFGREHISDILIAENVTPLIGANIVKFLNSRYGVNESTFYKLVQDDYKLYTFKP